MTSMQTYWIYAALNWKTQLGSIRAANIHIAHELAKRQFYPRGVVTSALKFTFQSTITYDTQTEQAA